MRTQDFDFYLPEHLIAQFPAKKRSASRLLHLDGKSGLHHDDYFKNIIDYISPKDIIVFNDTRVIKARLFGNKSSGGAIELMVERVINEHEVLAQIRASRSPKKGAVLSLAAGAIQAEVLDRHDDLFHVKFLHHDSVLVLLDEYGQLPLPPYIQHSANNEDESRYQTVFAKNAGAVAAPTAGLHFDDETIASIKNKGAQIAFLTLHVGAGTFQPVKAEQIHDHKMHSELYHIPDDTAKQIEQVKQAGGKVIAIGTTSLRALESASHDGKIRVGMGETSIFITPGYIFKTVDVLLTNFHLPKSTLLMLVSAFAGTENIKKAYQHAVANEYRFFSYGDAMLLESATQIRAEGY